jgi:hypothetical protein
MDAAGDLAQLVERGRHLARRVGQLFPKRGLSRRGIGRRCEQLQGDGDEVLLRPSCRSRSMRRRASSAAATMRAREALSSARATAFEIAVTISSAKPISRDSVSSVNASGPVE